MSLSLNQGINIVIEDGDQVIKNALADLNDKIIDLQSDVNTIEIKTNPLPADPSSQSLLDSKLNNIDNDLTNINANVVNVHNDVTITDGKVNAIKAKTDNLPAAPANQVTVNSILTNLGLLTDDEAIDSALGRLYILLKHMHGSTFTYPSNQNGLTITKAAGTWPGTDFPATKTEIVAANLITNPFDLHFMNTSAISANGEYEIGIFTGAAGAEVLKHIIPVSRSSVQSQEGRFNIRTEYFLANTRISLALRGSPAGTESVTVKVTGHEY